ncbi:hypothetical protein BD560DRAFT_338508 [Blakeslea trispora]|nr:hypothetical protein BD560DRAFT_338508 [Blakeslea trispora]
MPSLFQTLDLVLKNIDLADTTCTPATLACLPLQSLFTEVPADHWILARRPHILLVGDFFMFDPIRRCFRPLTRSDRPRFPYLSARLWKDLIVDNSLPYSHSFSQILVTPPTALGVIDESPFIQHCVGSFAWSAPNRVFRKLVLNITLPHSHSFSTLRPIQWTRFWHLPIRPDTRTFWYRVIHHKILSQRAISLFRPDSSDTCFFCHASQESPSHLLVECPLKWAVWSEVLSRQAPYLRFEPADVLNVIHRFAEYDYISPATLFTTCAATTLAIWQAHWSSVINDVPFSLPSVLIKVQKLL